MHASVRLCARACLDVLFCIVVLSNPSLSQTSSPAVSPTGVGSRKTPDENIKRDACSCSLWFSLGRKCLSFLTTSMCCWCPPVGLCLSLFAPESSRARCFRHTQMCLEATLTATASTASGWTTRANTTTSCSRPRFLVFSLVFRGSAPPTIVLETRPVVNKGRLSFWVVEIWDWRAL